MNAKLSTHALDLHQGRPAQGLGVRLYFLEEGSAPQLLLETATNEDGRTPSPLLGPAEMKVGRYELIFAVGAYFSRLLVTTSFPPFLDEVPIRFAIADANAAYHVPLLFSPWAYSTYRGS